MVKRYDCPQDYHYPEVDRLEMVPDPMGDYVLHSDYEALQLENAGLKAQLRWREYPAEKPDLEQSVLFDGVSFEYVEEDGKAYWQCKATGNAYECEDGDKWLPIPPVDREEGVI